MAPMVENTTVDTWPVVTPRSLLLLRRTAEQVGREFHRETSLDFTPFSPILSPHVDRLART
jgi:hypothetical protein